MVWFREVKLLGAEHLRSSTGIREVGSEEDEPKSCGADSFQYGISFEHFRVFVYFLDLMINFQLRVKGCLRRSLMTAISRLYVFIRKQHTFSCYPIVHCHSQTKGFCMVIYHSKPTGNEV